MAPSSELPTQVTAAHPGWTVDLAWTGELGETWRLTSPDGEIRYAKVRASGGHPPLSAERDRLEWAVRWITVPRVIDHGDDGEIEWLVTAALEGQDATIVKHTSDPAWLVPLLGEGLRAFHEAAPVDGCPFDFRLDVALPHCAQRVATHAESSDNLAQEFKHLTPEGVLRELVEDRPDDEDVVVCHGDYCFPNVLIEDGRVVAFLDLGDLGLADRWWDLAIGGWSTTWNVDPKWEPLFYEGYGIRPDPDRIRYYRMLYDLTG